MFEEAGISGEIANEPRAVYRYEKAPTANRPGGRDIAAYLMRVTEEKAVWPESRRRRRQWFGLEDAAARVKSRQLGAILSALARSPEASTFLDL